LSGNQDVSRPEYEEFVGYLRSALHYLYDPVHLRRSPLVDLLGLGTASDRASALQRSLTEAIRALKPTEDEPPQSVAWRIYDTLSLQYIRQFERDIVATQLGISERQLRREQRLALEALAQQLWQKHNLDALAFVPRGPGTGAPGSDGERFEPAPEKAEALNAELGWLKNRDSEQFETLQETLQTVQSLAQPLAKKWQVPLQLQIEPGQEDLPGPSMAIRSILLTLLNTIIPRVEAGPASITVLRAGPDIQIDITCAAVRLPHLDSSAKEETSLEAARQLAAFYGANLTVDHKAPALNVRLLIPAPEQIPVLVIDDNTDWLEMLQRYAVGSRYRVITTREPRSAAALAEKVQPALIFLDVMMPNIDGWQVLSELRQTSATHPIPVVVCTVLPLADLALSLGVNAFLQKPVTQDQFLDILDRLVEQPQV
jgi:CheY-like chemotaxis protein